MEIQNTPVCGGPAPRHALRTARKLAGFALQFSGSIRSASKAQRYLDVGCGNGFVTEIVANEFANVVGIDLEQDRLQDFRAHATEKFHILSMSAAEIGFPSEHFSFITCFEVLEHVTNLNAAVSEIVRVCERGGVVIISVPQVWFPFENHGARIGSRTYVGKIPFLPYVRPLHKKYSIARIFSSAEMDALFLSQGMELLKTGYVSPQFERSARNSGTWEAKFTFLRTILGRCEAIPLLRELTGVSMLKAYRKAL